MGERLVLSNWQKWEKGWERGGQVPKMLTNTSFALYLTHAVPRMERSFCKAQIGTLSSTLQTHSCFATEGVLGHVMLGPQIFAFKT